MVLPHIIHPKRFKIKGIFVEVVSHSSLTDEQAAKAAMLFFKSKKFKKNDQGKLYRVITTFDQQTSNFLSED